MKFRRIEDADILVCLEWYNWYIRNSMATFETKELTLEEFKDRVHHVTASYPWIILEDPEPVGYAYLSQFNERAAYDWTADVSVYLRHDTGHKGYGTALMKQLIRMAEQDGYKHLVSIVTEGNTASEHLHEACGFEKMAFFPDFGYKHHAWVGVTYYVLRLSDQFEDSPAEPEDRDV